MISKAKRNSGDKNILVFAGPAGSGKTTAIRIAQEYLREKGVVFQNEIINGFPLLIEKVREDDFTGGLNHYHLWCKKGGGHTHTNGTQTPHFPFVITGNYLWESMLAEITESLLELPKDVVYFFELAGGKNTNPSDEPAFAVDHSFAKIRDCMSTKVFSDGWVNRCIAVFHPKTDLPLRKQLNEKKSRFSSSTIEEETGTAFAYKLPELMNIFGQDDFVEIDPYFRERGVPVFNVENKGDAHFREAVIGALEECLSNRQTS
ncbi:MAG: ATP-binding protein [Candidatus Taylorbacteria bacterium]|nr:ATP-binding protein [Candidatus Taylorbacteria bacterium]